MSVKMMAWVAFGGATGSVARYLMMNAIGYVPHSGFPYATLVVNILGAFVMGSAIELMALVWSPSPEIRSFVIVGVLGGFTTFSTFSMDAFYLFERGQYSAFGLYVAASMLLTIFGLAVGMSVFRHILT